MYNVVRSELIRIWHRSFLGGGIGTMAASAGLVSWFVYSSATDPVTAAAAGPPDQAVATVAEIAEPGGFLTALGTISTLAGVVLLTLWAIATVRDDSTGMIRILVQAQPDRVKLLGGKIIALSLFTLLATLTTILTVMPACPLARLENIDTEAWRTDFAPHFFSSLLNFSIAGLVWALIGLALAVLTRSSELAIGIGIGYLLVVEPDRPHRSRCHRVPAWRHTQRPRVWRYQRTRLGSSSRARRHLWHRRVHRFATRLPCSGHQLLNGNSPLPHHRLASASHRRPSDRHPRDRVPEPGSACPVPSPSCSARSGC